MKIFVKVAWLQYVDSGEDFHELPSLEKPEESLNPRRSLTRSVDVETSANVVVNVGKSLADNTPPDSDAWDFKGTIGLAKVERVGIWSQFWDLQESCRIEHRKVSGSAAKAEELALKLVKQGSKQGAHLANNVILVALSL